MGEVLLGIGMGNFDWKFVEDIAISFGTTSLLGRFSFGLSKVAVTGFGGGGVMTLTLSLFADHSKRAGSGVSLGSILSGSTSGWMSVCAANFLRSKRSRLDGGAASVSWGGVLLPAAFGLGNELPLPPARRIGGSGILRSTCCSM